MMRAELVVVIGIVIVGYIAFMIYSHNVSSATQKKKKNRFSTSPPSSPSSQSGISKTGMILKVRENGLDQLDEATMIVKSRFARDEFLGSVDIIDGHHDKLPVPTYNSYNAPKSWTFVGDIKGSDSLFEQEVQGIMSELGNDGWKLKPVPSKGRTTIWLMTR